MLIGTVLVAAHLAGPAHAQNTGPATPEADGAGTAPQAAAPLPGTVPPAAAPPLLASDDKPFKRMIQNLFGDLRRMPSTSTAISLGIGGAAAAAILPIDDHVSEHASAGGTDQIFHVGGLIGGGYVQGGAAAATYALGRLAHMPRVSHLGADLIRGQILNGFLTHAVKLTFRRGRPGGEPGHLPATYSFPSAHTSAVWATTTVAWRHLGWKAGVPLSLIATYVGASRVQQRQHFLSDVAFGAALGIASGRTVTFDHGGRQIVAGPAAVPGGVMMAVQITRR